MVPASVIDHRGLMPYFHDRKSAWAKCYRESADIAACTERAGISVYPNPSVNALKEKLDYLKLHRLSFYSEPE